MRAKNNFDATPLTASGNSTSSDPQALAKLRQPMIKAKSAHDQHKKQKNSSSNCLWASITAVQTAQKQLDEAKQAPLELAALQAALASAKQGRERNQRKEYLDQEALNLCEFGSGR